MERHKNSREARPNKYIRIIDERGHFLGYILNGDVCIRCKRCKGSQRLQNIKNGDDKNGIIVQLSIRFKCIETANRKLKLVTSKVFEDYVVK